MFIHTPKMDIFQLIYDIGGMMGLMFGISALSLLSLNDGITEIRTATNEISKSFILICQRYAIRKKLKLSVHVITKLIILLCTFIIYKPFLFIYKLLFSQLFVLIIILITVIIILFTNIYYKLHHTL